MILAVNPERKMGTNMEYLAPFVKRLLKILSLYLEHHACALIMLMKNNNI